jgi:hypothetical protein
MPAATLAVGGATVVAVVSTLTLPEATPSQLMTGAPYVPGTTSMRTWATPSMSVVNWFETNVVCGPFLPFALIFTSAAITVVAPEGATTETFISRPFHHSLKPAVRV